jgi:hypothetical protein
MHLLLDSSCISDFIIYQKFGLDPEFYGFLQYLMAKVQTIVCSFLFLWLGIAELKVAFSHKASQAEASQLDIIFQDISYTHTYHVINQQ